MNQQQIKYARQRAETIFSMKKKSITDKHTTPAKQLSLDGRLKALTEGRFTILERPKDTGVYRDSWQNYVLFEGEVIASTDKDAIKTEVDALRVKYDTLLDELMLGDDEVALAMLKELENM